MLARFFMNEAIKDMGLELNREIVEEVNEIKVKLAELNEHSPEARELVMTKRELNQERIKALGMYLIPGGKY